MAVVTGGGEGIKAMADDNVDWRFLGRQVQILQGDVRDLRSNYLHLEGEIAGVKAELARMQADNGAKFEQVENHLGRIESEVHAGFQSMVTRFEQAQQATTANLETVLTAIRK